MKELTQTTARIADALATIVQSHITNRSGVVSLLTGEVVEDSETTSRHGERTFFNMVVHNDLGIFGTIIERVSFRVYYEKIDDGYWINTGLSYSHPGGGSNGHDVATVYLDDDFQLTAIRWPNGDLFRREEAKDTRAAA